MTKFCYNKNRLIERECVRLIDWAKISGQIVQNLGDQGKVTQILSDLETEVTTFNTRFSDMEKQTASQTEQIESLQRTNMNLFLKVGNPVPENIVNSNENQLTFENLFDEKGELK